MKNLKKIVLKITLILLLFITLKQIIPVLKLDGYSGFFLSILLFTDHSKYADDYSDRKFLKIKKGMSKEELIHILGKPFYEFSPTKGVTSLQYSKSPKDTHYRIRQVYLKKERVTERVSYFYID